MAPNRDKSRKEADLGIIYGTYLKPAKKKPNKKKLEQRGEPPENRDKVLKSADILQDDKDTPKKHSGIQGESTKSEAPLSRGRSNPGAWDHESVSTVLHLNQTSEATGREVDWGSGDRTLLSPVGSTQPVSILSLRSRWADVLAEKEVVSANITEPDEKDWPALPGTKPPKADNPHIPIIARPDESPLEATVTKPDIDSSYSAYDHTQPNADNIMQPHPAKSHPEQTAAPTAFEVSADILGQRIIPIASDMAKLTSELQKSTRVIIDGIAKVDDDYYALPQNVRLFLERAKEIELLLYESRICLQSMCKTFKNVEVELEEYHMSTANGRSTSNPPSDMTDLTFEPRMQQDNPQYIAYIKELQVELNRKQTALLQVDSVCQRARLEGISSAHGEEVPGSDECGNEVRCRHMVLKYLFGEHMVKLQTRMAQIQAICDSVVRVE